MSSNAETSLALHRLRRLYLGDGALEIGTPYHMLVMVIFSARTRDEQVLAMAPGFFQKFPTVEKLAKANIDDVTKALSSLGMYKQKAKNVHAMAKRVVDEHGGKIPKTMDELVALPGVGRKTASVLLVAAFDTPAIAVDTHVHRIANRLGWVKTKTPAQTEAKLLRLIPPALQHIANRVFVPFGRAVCVPGQPRCWTCPLVDVCAYTKKNMTPPKNADTILSEATARQEKIERLKDELREYL